MSSDNEFIWIANFPDEVIETLPKEITSGIYYGFASVDGGPVYKMVMSIGWNPHFKNVKRSMVIWFYLILRCDASFNQFNRKHTFYTSFPKIFMEVY